jgi:hypothetical protein
MVPTRFRKSLLFFVSSLAFAALPAWGDTIVNQEGATNPALNGFSTGAGVTSQGPVGTTAWNVQGDWSEGELDYFLSAGQITDLTTASNWAFTATYQNLSLNTTPTVFGPDTYGTDAIVSVNGVRFDLGLHTDGNGNQVLYVNPYTGGEDYTIPGLGTNSVTLEALYDNSTNTADIFVNGTKVISDYAGNTSEFTGNYVVFGGENGNFSQVELQSNVSATPEPGYGGLLAAILALLCCLHYRKFVTNPS